MISKDAVEKVEIIEDGSDMQWIHDHSFHD
jgi:hypothetical protein